MSRQYFHICNPTTPEQSACKNILSKKALQEIEVGSNAVYLLHVHLNWEGNKLSNNYGFDIANLIRTEKKSKTPIIFYSAIQQEYFEKKSEKEIKYKILFGRGSAFIEAPFKETALSKLADGIEPLSKAALHDIVTMLCNLKGIVIDKLNHDLKFEADIDKVIGSVSPYLSVEQGKIIQLDTFVSEIKARIKAKDKNGFLNEKLKFITLCNQELTEKGKDKPQAKKTKHKVLVIDDLPKEIEKAKKYLKEDFILETAITSKQAISILKNDVANKIIAVVSDWRLFTDAKQNYWQPLQGYEVLDFAAKNGIRSLFALTSQADFVVHQLRNLMGIRFSMFKKENLNTADQWKVFADVLFEACFESVNARASILDDSTFWNPKDKSKRTLKDCYIEMWNSIDRDSSLLLVNKKADGLWKYVTTEKDPFIVGNYPEFEMSVKVLNLHKFLVLRRIYIGLWYQLLPSGNMGEEGKINHSKKIHKIIWNVGDPLSMNARRNNLCLKLDNMTIERMFPEEKEWLIKKNLL